MVCRAHILAIASAGGHWVQLRRMRSAFIDMDVLWVSTTRGYKDEMEKEERFAVVPDANRWQRIRLLRCTLMLFILFIRHRPQIVVTTGAAPGYIAIRIAKLFGARTIWVDSIANADELSMSGKLALRVADEVLTQWPHLAASPVPRFEGAVL